MTIQIPTTTTTAAKLAQLRVRAVRVPMHEPHQTASGAVAESPLVLTDALFDDGVVGHSVVFTYTPAALKPVADLVRNFEALVKGEPLSVHQGMADVAGVVGSGIAWNEAAVERFAV